MRQATNLKDLKLPMLLPGMKVNTSSENSFPIRQMQLAIFNGVIGSNLASHKRLSRRGSLPRKIDLLGATQARPTTYT